MKVSLRSLGPGLAVAATGVGAGDMVAATVAGSRFGMTVVWAVVVGAALKFVLNEGLARWQLATGTTLLEGWFLHFGKPVRWYFAVYLVVWSFVVGGALVSACGLATHALFPQISVSLGAVLHGLLGIAVVWWGKYESFERFMKVGIVLLFVSLLGCSWSVQPPWISLWEGVTSLGLPADSIHGVLGMIGGVGGSLTLLSYGYWIREKGWQGQEALSLVRWDLAVAYGLTGLFGVAVVVLAAQILLPSGTVVSGSTGVLQMGQMLSAPLGKIGTVTFAVGFWAAVTTSLIGVWQSVPYLFADWWRLTRGEGTVSNRSRAYRGYLLYLGVAPLALLFLDKPVFLILLYAVVGALFMPFLAFTLLWLNRPHGPIEKSSQNHWTTTVALFFCLGLFGWLCGVGVWESLARI